MVKLSHLGDTIESGRALRQQPRPWPTLNERIDMRQGRCSDCLRERGILARGKCSTCYAAWHRRENGRTDKRYRITCEHCGENHEASIADARFCSQRCKARHLAGWSTSTEIVHIGPVEGPRRKPQPPRQRAQWWKFLVHGPCAICGEAFTALAASPSSAPIYCSPACARRATKARRRARKRGAFVQNVSRRQVFERDRWTCQLCGRRVARAKQAPHPKAPVLDHIIPLAKGGTHEPRNTQCAHFLCNSLKGDRGTDQLRLIG